MKRVLLTGGTGLVGTDIRKQLIKAGYKIYLLVNHKVKEATGINLIYCDMADVPSGFFRSLPKVDAVVHAGAVVNIPEDQDEFCLLRKVNMEFSENLFHWVTSLKKKIPVVYFNSPSFLQKPLEKIITESHPVAPILPYSISKIWGEKALLKYTEIFSYRAISFRISSPIVFDFKLLHETVVKKWISQAKEGKVISVYGKGERSQDFVATTDIAEAVMKAIENKNAKGIYNIASGSMISMSNLAKLISQCFKIKVKYIKVDCENSDQWNISIKKAYQDFGFIPKYNSEEVIKKLIDSILGE